MSTAKVSNCKCKFVQLVISSLQIQIVSIRAVKRLVTSGEFREMPRHEHRACSSNTGAAIASAGCPGLIHVGYSDHSWFKFWYVTSKSSKKSDPGHLLSVQSKLLIMMFILDSKLSIQSSDLPCFWSAQCSPQCSLVLAFAQTGSLKRWLPERMEVDLRWSRHGKLSRSSSSYQQGTHSREKKPFLVISTLLIEPQRAVGTGPSICSPELIETSLVRTAP